jgi:hypothetical protein
VRTETPEAKADGISTNNRGDEADSDIRLKRPNPYLGARPGRNCGESQRPGEQSSGKRNTSHGSDANRIRLIDGQPNKKNQALKAWFFRCIPTLSIVAPSGVARYNIKVTQTLKII